MPRHVAWVAAGSSQWVSAGGRDGSLAAAEDQALLELVDGAAGLGIRWLTIQEPSSGRALEGRDRPGIRVVRRRLGAPLDAAEHEGLLVVLEPPASGRQELVEAIRRLADDGVDPDDVRESTIARYLDLPDVDLLVKTGGERCIPDLLLWQAAYSELVFLDVLWPDVRRDHLFDAVEEYRRRDRRYGGVVASK